MLAGFCYLTESATCNVSWIVMASYLQGRVHQYLLWALGGVRHRRAVGFSFGQFEEAPCITPGEE